MYGIVVFRRLPLVDEHHKNALTYPMLNAKPRKKQTVCRRICKEAR